MTSINIGFSQDKLGFGNMPDGVDSAGFGTVTTWVKPSSEADSVYLCGEWYKTVTIGTQTWLQRNLHCDDLEGGIYSYNNDTGISDEYGYLYLYDAIIRIDGTISGWHLPSYDEFSTLITYLGGESISGGKLKETGYTHWSSPNNGATNESGFTAFGAGRYAGTYQVINTYAIFWTSTYFEESDNYGIQLFYDAPQCNFSGFSTIISAQSVRLIKD